MANSEQQCHSFHSQSTSKQEIDDYGADAYEAAEDDEEEWKRAARYIAGIIVFFYVLFKYLI